VVCLALGFETRTSVNKQEYFCGFGFKSET
jgi:hypothetical protein